MCSYPGQNHKHRYACYHGLVFGERFTATYMPTPTQPSSHSNLQPMGLHPVCMCSTHPAVDAHLTSPASPADRHTGAFLVAKSGTHRILTYRGCYIHFQGSFLLCPRGFWGRGGAEAQLWKCCQMLPKPTLKVDPGARGEDTFCAIVREGCSHGKKDPSLAQSRVLPFRLKNVYL